MSIRLLLFFAARARVSEEHDTQAKQIVARFMDMYFVGYICNFVSEMLFNVCVSSHELRTKIAFGMDITGIFRNAIGSSENGDG